MARGHRIWFRGVATLGVVGVVAAALLASPAGAHIDGWPHLKGHIKKIAKKIAKKEAQAAVAAFAQGEIYTRTFTVDAVGFLPQPMPFVEVPTMGKVELLGCFGTNPYSIRVRLLSNDDAQPFVGVGTMTGSEPPAGFGPAPVNDQTAGSFSSGGGEPLIAEGGTTFGTVGHWEYGLWRGSGDNISGAHVSIDGFNDKSKCYVSAEVHLI
jgi:hypothetical protein